jgi:hypothetical protein
MFVSLIKRFAIMAVAVPLAAAGARKLGDVVEKRRGPNGVSNFLRQGAEFVQGFRAPKKRR